MDIWQLATERLADRWQNPLDLEIQNHYQRHSNQLHGHRYLVQVHCVTRDGNAEMV